jgi:uncharacterized damage-inducible protein DinB
MVLMANQPAWLRGPIAGVPATLQPVAHALVDADEDVQATLAQLSTEMLWARPGGAASIAFHTNHAMGSLDRLFTYARGEALNDVQLAALAAEKTLVDGSMSAGQLAAEFSDAVKKAHAQLRVTSEADLLDTRLVGRARLPSTVLGLLVHAAEHTARHVGQIVTTARILGAVPR